MRSRLRALGRHSSATDCTGGGRLLQPHAAARRWRPPGRPAPQHLDHPPGARRPDLVLHLHRLDREQRGALGHLVADGHGRPRPPGRAGSPCTSIGPVCAAAAVSASARTPLAPGPHRDRDPAPAERDDPVAARPLDQDRDRRASPLTSRPIPRSRSTSSSRQPAAGATRSPADAHLVVAHRRACLAARGRVPQADPSSVTPRRLGRALPAAPARRRGGRPRRQGRVVAAEGGPPAPSLGDEAGVVVAADEGLVVDQPAEEAGIGLDARR